MTSTSPNAVTTEKNGQASSDEDFSAGQLRQEREAMIDRLLHLKPDSDAYATEFVDQVLRFAAKVETSDLHLQPTFSGFEVRFRNDGVLQMLGEFPKGASSSIVSRLKVLSNLLTYQSDIPQEGRLEAPVDATEVRVSTFPTLHGERAVMRFFGHGNRFKQLDDLGFPSDITQAIKDVLVETSGAFLICGPAGSGKSTTLYACLRHLVEKTRGSRNLMTLEDPIEVPIAGTSQSQVNAAAGFGLNTGLRSLLRQDPEVIMIGEIRDPDTAETAIQASLTGQLMLTTFHSDSAVTAVSRLLDMDIEPYLLRSGIIGILCQRLLRVACRCATMSSEQSDFYGLPISETKLEKGCDECNHSGYSGRTMICEFLSLKDAALASEILDTKDSRATYRIAVEHGMKSLWESATELVRDGTTTAQEVRRVLGASMRI